jgi:hypothetical protein
LEQADLVAPSRYEGRVRKDADKICMKKTTKERTELGPTRLVRDRREERTHRIVQEARSHCQKS